MRKWYIRLELRQRGTGNGLCLGLTAVLPSVLAIDAFKVEPSRPDVVEGALRGIRAGVVVLLAQLQGAEPELSATPSTCNEHEDTNMQRIDVFLARHHLHAREALDEVHLLLDLRRVAPDADREEAARKPAAKSEHADALPAQLRGLDAREERREAAVQRRSVHVATAPRALHRFLDGRLKLGLGDGHERLLKRLIRQRLLVWLREDGLGVWDGCVFR